MNTRRLLAIQGILVSAAFIPVTYAHCPLCTAGAGAAAIGAAYLGVKSSVIGLFIGAFAIALGLWTTKLIKKNYIPHQKWALAFLSFALTVFPLMPIVKGFFPLYLQLAGDYGSLLNRTYLINLFFAGSIIGGAIMLVSPKMSSKITEFREGKKLPYQGLLLDFGLLLVAGTIMQLVI